MITTRDREDDRPMLDPDLLLLCEHELVPRECPICGRDDAERPIFDPVAWVQAFTASARTHPDVPTELHGVPFA